MEKNEKKYWLENLFDLESITKFIRIIPKTFGSPTNVSFVHNGKGYNITKSNKEIKMSCNDGRELSIVIKELSNSTISGVEEKSINIAVEYKLLDSFLQLYKGMHNTILTDLEDFDAYEMSTNLCFLSCSNGNMLQLYKDFTRDGIDNFTFTKNGIQYKDYLISYDCEKVISARGRILPSKEEIEKFSLENEQKSYLELLNSSNLDSRTKEVLINLFNLDEIVKEYKEVLDLYNNRLTSLKTALIFYQALVDGTVEEYLFTREELDLFLEKLTEALKDKISEYDDIDVLGEARKLVKSISDKGIEILKKIMDEIQ